MVVLRSEQLSSDFSLLEYDHMPNLFRSNGTFLFDVLFMLHTSFLLSPSFFFFPSLQQSLRLTLSCHIELSKMLYHDVPISQCAKIHPSPSQAVKYVSDLLGVLLVGLDMSTCGLLGIQLLHPHYVDSHEILSALFDLIPCVHVVVRVATGRFPLACYCRTSCLEKKAALLSFASFYFYCLSLCQIAFCQLFSMKEFSTGMFDRSSSQYRSLVSRLPSTPI